MCNLKDRWWELDRDVVEARRAVQPDVAVLLSFNKDVVLLFGRYFSPPLWTVVPRFYRESANSHHSGQAELSHHLSLGAHVLCLLSSYHKFSLMSIKRIL